MSASTRTFAMRPAVRGSVPLLIGLVGPSGSGKTYSALELATGIQSVTGGEIAVIDTESRRALHYADIFNFQHVQFDAPFGALDYLTALKHCQQAGARVIVVDSMSHEHEGPGGLLDAQEAELTRMADDNWSKREACKMAAWIKPKAARRQLINGLLQLNANFIFCFRAKEKTAMGKKANENGREKTTVENLGWMPIAGEEFVFEMTANCLLMPAAHGVPTWSPENKGERKMLKLPIQFRGVLDDGRPLSREHGARLAQWARGDSAAATEPLEALRARLRLAASEGMDNLRAVWGGLKKKDQRSLGEPFLRELQGHAATADAKKTTVPNTETMTRAEMLVALKKKCAPGNPWGVSENQVLSYYGAQDETEFLDHEVRDCFENWEEHVKEIAKEVVQ